MGSSNTATINQGSASLDANSNESYIMQTETAIMFL